MLECSGAASAVNADGMCCKDDLSIAFSFICVFGFFTVVCGIQRLILN